MYVLVKTPTVVMGWACVVDEVNAYVLHLQSCTAESSSATRRDEARRASSLVEIIGTAGVCGPTPFALFMNSAQRGGHVVQVTRSTMRGKEGG